MSWVGTKEIIHTYVRVTICCCVCVSGVDGANQRHKKVWRWEQGAFLCNSQPACQPLFLFTVNTLTPITLSCFPSQWCDSKPARCPGQVLNFALTLALTCRNICQRTQAGFTRIFTNNTTRIHTHVDIFFNCHGNVLFLVLTSWCDISEAGTRKVLWLEVTWSDTNSTCCKPCQQ